MEERLLERYRHQAINRHKSVLYFTKLLIAWIVLFPCLMKEMCKWSTGGMILAEKWQISMSKTCSKSIMSSTNVTGAGLESNPCLHGESSAIKYLILGTTSDYKRFDKGRFVSPARQKTLFARHSSARHSSHTQAFLPLCTSLLPFT